MPLDLSQVQRDVGYLPDIKDAVMVILCSDDIDIPLTHGYMVQALSKLGFKKFTTTGTLDGGMVAVVHSQVNTSPAPATNGRRGPKPKGPK